MCSYRPSYNEKASFLIVLEIVAQRNIKKRPLNKSIVQRRLITRRTLIASVVQMGIYFYGTAREILLAFSTLH